MTIYFFWITHKHCVSPCSQLRMEVSLWEHIKCFPCTLRGRNWKTQQPLVIFHSVVFEESSFREITLFTWRHRFRKSPFSRVWTLPKKADITHLITHLLSLLLEAILFFQVCLKLQWRFEAVFHHQGYIKKLWDLKVKIPSFSSPSVHNINIMTSR